MPSSICRHYPNTPFEQQFPHCPPILPPIKWKKPLSKELYFAKYTSKERECYHGGLILYKTISHQTTIFRGVPIKLVYIVLSQSDGIELIKKGKKKSNSQSCAVLTKLTVRWGEPLENRRWSATKASLKQAMLKNSRNASFKGLIPTPHIMLKSNLGAVTYLKLIS